MTKDEVDAVLASATDLANSWAREVSVAEAQDERELCSVIDRLWSKTSIDHFNLVQALDEITSRVVELCHRKAFRAGADEVCRQIEIQWPEAFK